MTKIRWVMLACALVVSLVLLSGCPNTNKQSASWKNYHNPRYGFEFPYPSNWIANRMPDDRDGQAFSDPTLPAVEIRGWAGFDINASVASEPEGVKENFTTQQGLTGELQVAVGADMSMMTLTLKQGAVIYNWQGRSPSQQFADYYRFFYYVASKYQVKTPESRG